MKKKIQFLKMSGAGNDFIMVDNRDGLYSLSLQKKNIADLCRRGLSVGADGLIEIRNDPEEEHAFAMKYYNSDGGVAEMCGNGARCICCFAVDLGIARSGVEFLFSSDAGIHRGLVTGKNEARVWLTEPVLYFTEKSIRTDREINTGFADTGVPHAVVFTDDLEDGSFEENASILRSHPEFGSRGANVNWVSVLDDGSMSMRTFERGVEAETLACGTGAVASALIASERFDSITLPVRIVARSGLTLTVGRDSMGWWLQGEARIVYRAEIVI
ncbi:MAG: diaminopimelate epimerase [Candidatus Sabulitectum sp.]|nr:diaminopimelate epimerase [Candidatus Sabulitectum sp.]